MKEWLNFKRKMKSLQERIDKLKMILRGKGLLQGAKHIIWDSIANEASKFRVYLNFINDKDNISITSRSRCTVVNETLAKKPSEWAQNAINLLNSIPTAKLQTIGVKDITTLIIWVKRVIGKHNLLKSIQTKETQMEQSVHESSKICLKNCLSKASHHFGMARENCMIRKNTMLCLTQCRMDHYKFETLEENLKGATLVEHLITDFEILNQFKAVKIGLPVMTYASCIDLEILIKEMIDYDIPSDLQWKEIVRLGKTKCSFPGSSKGDVHDVTEDGRSDGRPRQKCKGRILSICNINVIF
jgi:hypothetical protein